MTDRMPLASNPIERRPAAPEPTPQARPAPAPQTLIEEGTSFKGVMSSTCPIVVRGSVEGEIFGPSLKVSSSGLVAGTVQVQEIRSEGVLSGEFDADSITLSGQVKDKTVIRAKNIEVSLSPERGKMELVFGECDLAVGDAPSKEQAIQEAMSADSGIRKGNGVHDEAKIDDDDDDDDGKSDRRSGKKRSRSKGDRARAN